MTDDHLGVGVGGRLALNPKPQFLKRQLPADFDLVLRIQANDCDIRLRIIIIDQSAVAICG